MRPKRPSEDLDDYIAKTIIGVIVGTFLYFLNKMRHQKKEVKIDLHKWGQPLQWGTLVKSDWPCSNCGVANQMGQLICYNCHLMLERKALVVESKEKDPVMIVNSGEVGTPFLPDDTEAIKIFIIGMVIVAILGVCFISFVATTMLVN